jgi:short-subunit dehydrogenase
MSKQNKGVALVTGASAGIGAVYADRLARRGYDLILTARRTDRLQALSDRLAAETGQKIEVVAADLANRADLKRVEDILRNDASITLLVNNAGVAAVTPLVKSNVDEMSNMISVNVDALMRLTYAAAPKFVERGAGAIINISSVTALGPERLNGVYGASKAFVLAFSQSLKHELADKGVRIQVVLPGATATDIWPNAGVPIANLPKDIVMSTEDMVDASLAGLDQGEFATAPALGDATKWQSYEKIRTEVAGELSRSLPAARYGVKSATR